MAGRLWHPVPRQGVPGLVQRRALHLPRQRLALRHLPLQALLLLQEALQLLQLLHLLELLGVVLLLRLLLLLLELLLLLLGLLLSHLQLLPEVVDDDVSAGEVILHGHELVL